jgi:hypothetical protein
MISSTADNDSGSGHARADDVNLTLACVVMCARKTRSRHGNDSFFLFFSVGQTAVSADFAVSREMGNICRVVRHVADMSPTHPT